MLNGVRVLFAFRLPAVEIVKEVKHAARIICLCTILFLLVGFSMNSNASEDNRKLRRSSKYSRRAFFGAAGGAIAGGGVIASCSHVEDPKVRAHTSTAPGPPQKQSEDGVVYHKDVHTTGNLMKGFPPERQNRVHLGNWAASKDHFRWLHLNGDVIFHSVPVDKGNGPTWVLPRKMIDPKIIDSKEVPWGMPNGPKETITVAEWLRRSETDAFLLIHDGHIVAETYFGTMTPQTRHVLWSTSKSVLATVLAPSIHKGELNADAKLSDYVPEFADSGFAGATVRQALDMQTGIRFMAFPPEHVWKTMKPEERAEWEPISGPGMRRAKHEFARWHRIAQQYRRLPEEPSDVGNYDFLLTLKKDHNHGEYFYYAEPNVLALQLVLEHKTGVPYLQHLGTLMKDLGLENTPMMAIDGIGTPNGNTGLRMTARDLGRWGLYVCNRGSRTKDGKNVAAGIGAMMDDIGNNPCDEKWTKKTQDYGYLPFGSGYRSFFWNHPGKNGTPIPWSSGFAENDVIIDAERNNVLVKLSTCTTYPDNYKNYTAKMAFVEDVFPTLTR